MNYILQTHNLSKSLKGKELISNVNIHIKKGEIYGFLGPNGAGKTTVMRMITNLWKPSSGEIVLFDEVLTSKSYEVLKRMGSILEFPVFMEDLDGRENLELHCEYMGYYSPDCVKNALELLGLENTGKKPVRGYSLGMKQRLAIARAIMTKPELLILDEPTNGLDPAGIRQIRDLLKMLCTDYGITIMISSHLLSEIQNLADTIGVIRHGKMIKEITIEEFTEMNLAYIELKTTNTQQASYLLTEILKIHNFKIIDNNIIRIYDKNISAQELSKTLAINDIPFDYLNRQSLSLEDYFLKITEEDK